MCSVLCLHEQYTRALDTTEIEINHFLFWNTFSPRYFQGGGEVDNN